MEVLSQPANTNIALNESSSSFINGEAMDELPLSTTIPFLNESERSMMQPIQMLLTN